MVDMSTMPRGIICAVVLLNENHDALLQLRDEKPGLSASGLWVFPGGHTDPGEDILDCAYREFLEETDYKCDQLNWVMAVKDDFTDPKSSLIHIFWEFYKEGSKYTCHEGQALEFISRKDAGKLKIPEYLLYVWDIVILSAKLKNTYGGSKSS